MSKLDGKKGPEWVSRLIAAFFDPKVVVTFLAALGLGGGGGFVMADSGVTPDTVRQIADSTTKAQLAPIVRQIEAASQENRAAFGALMEALPAFKKAVQELGQANADASRRKAETDTLLTNLTEAKR